ncbi:BZ3500_MvSof-1268-A1-R1_Chr4-2g07099 [Microbotryum saponariae]|uniref:BZ3500_MvSof-1268-A1-R1_Chr4-2g07099 protein n=1 Tax=Microbotryum saponariae TaxID=289078 RepID=A0A2X0KXU0_9BASI|nr:BZ3500_MvSof-1268-A1-R1_Chr4-2g07099 [Microbotryum saponariae]
MPVACAQRFRHTPVQQQQQQQQQQAYPLASTSRTTLDDADTLEPVSEDSVGACARSETAQDPPAPQSGFGKQAPPFAVTDTLELHRTRSDSTSSIGSSKGKEKACDDGDGEGIGIGLGADDPGMVLAAHTLPRVRTVAVSEPSCEEGSSSSTHDSPREKHSIAWAPISPPSAPGTVQQSPSAKLLGTPSRTTTTTARLSIETATLPSGDLAFSLASSTRPILNEAGSIRGGSAETSQEHSSAGRSDAQPNIASTTSGQTSRGEGSGPIDGTSSFWATTSWKMRSGKATVDQKRLRALGFNEELSRDFDFWASAGLTICNIGGFPGTVLAVLTAMRTGGSSMYVFAWPISGLFFMSLAAVLGEMASTWPVAGAMFTWTFRLCRSSRRLDIWARYLSWIVGSFLLCSHILLQIVITWQFSHNLLGTIGLYSKTNSSIWVPVGICWSLLSGVVDKAVLLGSGLIVSSPIVRSPWFWRGCGFMTIVFFLTLNITLLTQAKTIKSAKWVFSNYENDTGFSSKSYVYMLGEEHQYVLLARVSSADFFVIDTGWVFTCVASGMEAAAHIAEDTRAPARTVPQSMFWSLAATYGMGWVSICVLLATLDASSLDPTLQPSIALIANSIPRAHTTVVLIFVLLSFAFQSIAQLLATSRFTWALARESALPLSPFLRKLTPKSRLPLRAIWCIVAIAFPAMLLIIVDYSIIATIILEGAGFSVMFSYTVPVLIYLFLPRDALSGDGRALWTLRKWSKPAALAGTLFALIFMIMLCLPTAYPVNAISASYASAVLVLVFLLATLAWVFYGNAHYAGPIKTTTKWTIGAEIELPRSATMQKTPTPAGGTNSPVQALGPRLTESEFLGRTAHVFSSFEGEGTTTHGMTTRMSGTRIEMGRETMGTSHTGMGTEWSTDWDEEEEEYSSEEEEEAPSAEAGTTSRSQKKGSSREVDSTRWRPRRDQEADGPSTPDASV